MAFSVTFLVDFDQLVAHTSKKWEAKNIHYFQSISYWSFEMTILGPSKRLRSGITAKRDLLYRSTLVNTPTLWANGAQ